MMVVESNAELQLIFFIVYTHLQLGIEMCTH